MDDLISRKALIEDLEAARDNSGMGAVIAATLIRYVKRQKTIDSSEVIHGRWIRKEHDDTFGGYFLFHCSECDTPNARERNFCPECGAKMEVRKNG